MIKSIIDFSIKERVFVLLGAFVLAVVGFYAYITTPIDAIPDLSDVQVIVLTKYPGQSPQVVEDQVTYPLTTAMLSVPNTKVVRGFSFFGLSFVYVIFDDDVDMYWARSRVLEALNFASNRLPQGITPTLGPDATGVGWIYEYALVDKTGQYDTAELRSLQDWFLRYPLQTVPGVAEVASVGGFVRQYQIEVDPNALLRYNITLDTVKNAVKQSNNNVGGRLIELAETEYMVRSQGYIESVEDINTIPLGVDNVGTPILIRDIGHVQIGPELRRGLADLNGEGEVAGGIVIMRYGENALATIKAVRAKLEELRPGLLDGVEIVPVYDRGDLIERASASLTVSLMEELLIVSLVLILFLMHARSAFVAIITLPLGILIAFVVMRMQGLSANIMSLGGIAIAIGTMVDGAIVMVENAHKQLAQASADVGGRALTTEERWDTIRHACQQVGPALFFSLLVITVSFVPIFTLQSQEGRLFSPLAFTKTYAMAAAAILSITLVPVLMGYFLRGKILAEDRNPLNRIMRALHTPVLRMLMKFKRTTIVCAIAMVAVTLYPYSQLGSEFMPPLDEGDILYMPTTLPGISITKAKELLQQTDRILATFPEVASVFGKIGRADTATDSAPLSMIETTVRLTPKDEWPNPSKTTRELMNEMDASLQLPGLSNAWTMPIKTRLDMLSTGIKTPVGVKVSGPDLDTLQTIASRIEQIVQTLPETLSAFGDRTVGGYYLDITIDRASAARYGLTVGQVQDVIMTAIGGMNITQTIEGIERYPVNLRFPRAMRSDMEGLKRVLIPTESGAPIPLAMVADLAYTRDAPMIKSENARPNAWVYIDISSSDIGGYVAKAGALVEEEIDLPAGYTLIWSGEFEHMERAAAQMRIVVPATLFVIFLLLYIHFRRVTEPVVVMLSIPFGLVGGIWLIYFNGFNVSVAVAVGFIALAGMAAEIGVLVLSFIAQEVTAARSQKVGKLTSDDIRAAALSGTAKRVRPVVMTAVSTIAGLIPIALSDGTGSDVTQRIAAPMLGGMVTVLILNLFVLPVVYTMVLQRRERALGDLSID